MNKPQLSRPRVPVGIDALPNAGLWAYDDRQRSQTLYALQDPRGLAAFTAVKGVTRGHKTWDELQQRNPWRLIGTWADVMHPWVFAFDDPKTGNTVYVTRSREAATLCVVEGVPQPEKP